MSDGPWPACPRADGSGRVTAEGLRWLEWRIPRALDLLREIAIRDRESLNATEIGRRLGLSCHAVLHRIGLLEEAGLIRFLPSLASRRLHLLVKDCRLLAELGGSRRAVLRTCLTERITAALAGRSSFTGCFQWEAGRVRRIDLVAFTGRERIGFRFTGNPMPRNRHRLPLRMGTARGVIDRGFLIHCGIHACVTARVVIALPVWEFLGRLDRWLACGSFREAQGLLCQRSRDILEQGWRPDWCAYAPPAHSP